MTIVLPANAVLTGTGAPPSGSLPSRTVATNLPDALQVLAAISAQEGPGDAGPEVFSTGFSASAAPVRKAGYAISE